MERMVERTELRPWPVGGAWGVPAEDIFINPSPEVVGTWCRDGLN
ncbi:MAG TPA: hypothetical protein QF694_05675 [Dehalococcoidia bacterium]|nr:hypothetical protein [Dehalococcoidia bacterium]HJP28279.1 hypothetical protein [Dehalococcoidia bacterium]